MEPPSSNKIPPDRARENSLVIDSSTSTPTLTMSAAAVSSQPNANNQLVLYAGERPSASASSSGSFVSLASNVSSSSSNAPSTSSSSVSTPIEKLSRPMAFDKVSVYKTVFTERRVVPHCYHHHRVCDSVWFLPAAKAEWETNESQNQHLINRTAMNCSLQAVNKSCETRRMHV